MRTRTLGRTGLQATILGLGGGGPSRLGQRFEVPEEQSISILKQALDAGVNFIDTAEAYGTEEIVGKAIAGRPRDSVIISTKKATWEGDVTPDSLRESLNASLERLGTDYIDIYHLHGVRVDDYDYLLNEIVPAMQQEQQAGKIRYLGITEAWNSDRDHATLRRALQDDVWDVMMVGFNMLNQSARETIFPETIKQDIGTLIMFAVRNALSKPEHFAEVMAELDGRVNLDALDGQSLVDYVIEEGGATSLTDAAYRFCMYEPGAHVILSGTGNPDHLRANIETFQRPPLPDYVVETLKTAFAGIDDVTGQ